MKVLIDLMSPTSLRSLLMIWLNFCRQLRCYGLQIVKSIIPVLLHRKLLCLKHWEEAVWGSAQIMIIAGFSVGIVSWFQLKEILVIYGAEANLPSMLALAVVVQTGPLLAGLISAARLGAGIAAELGTMNYAEELDALESLGINIIEALVVPRMFAAVLALPALTVMIDISAISGALIAESLCGEIKPTAYLERSLDLLTLPKAIPATFKTAIFGFMISISATYIGLHCPREAEAVGRSALKGVVTSISCVLAADFFLVPFIQWANWLIFQNS